MYVHDGKCLANRRLTPLVVLARHVPVQGSVLADLGHEQQRQERRKQTDLRHSHEIGSLDLRQKLRRRFGANRELVRRVHAPILAS